MIKDLLYLIFILMFYICEFIHCFLHLKHNYAVFTAVVNLPIMKIVEPFENKNIYDQKN